ncbi:MAG: hypothetical protein ACJA0G_002548, partial [Kangiellaceae bacterium]
LIFFPVKILISSELPECIEILVLPCLIAISELTGSGVREDIERGALGNEFLFLNILSKDTEKAEKLIVKKKMSNINRI